MWGSGSQIVSYCLLFFFFFLFSFFAYGSELGMQEAVAMGLRERQRASMKVERVVEAQSRLRKWITRKSEEKTQLK